jgi:hypothetical protein
MKSSVPVSRSHATCALTLAVLGAALASHPSAFGTPQLAAGPNTSTADTVAFSDTVSDPYEYLHAESSATFGVLRAYSTASTNPEAFAPGFGSSASFRDDWTFDAEGLAGTAGTAVVRFTIDGTLTAIPQGTPTYTWQANSTYANANYTFGANNPTSVTKSQRLYGDGRTSGTMFLGIEQTHVLNFTFGQTLEDVKLQITTYTLAAGSYGYSSTTTADLSHTANWGGIVEVRDSNGDLVTNYSFTSASGTDFTQPIPEPGTCVLLILGGLVFNAARARRRSR